MFGKGIRIMRLLGFEVTVDASWLILAALVTWSLAQGTFPFYYPGFAAATYWIMGVVGALALFASILAHEFSHSLVARRFGLPIRRITLFIFGGVSDMEDEPETPRAEFATAIVGPLSSLLIAFASWGVLLAGARGGWALPLLGVLAYLRTVNLALAVFNMIPAFPLDGGRLLRATLWKWRGNLQRATRVAAWIGEGFGFLLIALAMASIFFAMSLLNGLWWGLIGLFLVNAARSSYRGVAMRETLRGEPVRRFLTREPVTVPPEASVQQLVDDYIYRYHSQMLPVVGDGELRGCVGAEQVKQVPREQWSSRTVGELARPCADRMISIDADAADALAKMQRLAAGWLLVVEDGRLVGVVSMQDLMRLFALKTDLERRHDRAA